MRRLIAGFVLTALWSRPSGRSSRTPSILASASCARNGLAPGEAIVLDGALDEAVWKRAVSAGEFVQQDPVLGAEPTERTEVRFASTRITSTWG